MCLGSNDHATPALRACLLFVIKKPMTQQVIHFHHPDRPGQKMAAGRICPNPQPDCWTPWGTVATACWKDRPEVSATSSLPFGRTTPTPAQSRMSGKTQPRYASFSSSPTRKSPQRVSGCCWTPVLSPTATPTASCSPPWNSPAILTPVAGMSPSPAKSTSGSTACPPWLSSAPPPDVSRWHSSTGAPARSGLTVRYWAASR